MCVETGLNPRPLDHAWETKQLCSESSEAPIEPLAASGCAEVVDAYCDTRLISDSTVKKQPLRSKLLKGLIEVSSRDPSIDGKACYGRLYFREMHGSMVGGCTGNIAPDRIPYGSET